MDAQCSDSFQATGGIYSSWIINGEVVTFTISATTTGWVAIGFSPTADTVYEMKCPHITAYFVLLLVFDINVNTD